MPAHVPVAELAAQLVAPARPDRIAALLALLAYADTPADPAWDTTVWSTMLLPQLLPCCTDADMLVAWRAQRRAESGGGRSKPPVLRRRGRGRAA